MSVHSEEIALLREKPELLAEVEALPGSGRAADPNGAALLRDIEAFIGSFVILPPGALLPVALWVMATHTHESFDTFPYLALLSPAKRCGKTRLTEVLGLVVRSARQTVNISEAALFRLIEAFSPSLMLDEAEALAGKTDRAEAIRALLNAGNRRGATVPRCVGKNHEVKEFRVYCPKLICGIGACPETIRDRSIVLNMQRKRPSDRVERFIFRSVKPAGEVLQAKLAAWAAEHKSEFEELYSRMDGLRYLGDRDAEAWEPLFVLLAVADPQRLTELKDSAIRLSGSKAAADEDDSLGLRLLADIRDVWRTDSPAMTTADLLSRLGQIEEGPWREEIPLNPRKLSRLLRGFDVAPRTVRTTAGRGKGYVQTEVESAFSRYLSVASVTSVTSAENIE